MLEGILTGNQEAIDAGKKIIDLTYPLGWDPKYGGIISFTDISGNPPIQLEWDMKLWWPQCETMIAARMAYMLFKEEKYLQIYTEIEKYCQMYLVDHKHGEWYGYLHYDNTVASVAKGNVFKGPYHIPRLYIIMAMLDSGRTMEEYAR